MIFKLSYLNSNLALTLGYLNPALNNSAQGFKWGREEISRRGDSEGRETSLAPSAFLA